MEIRRSYDRLISTMRFPILIRLHLYWIRAKVPATVYPKKYAHGFCFAVLCCGYTLTDFPISIRLTSLVLWQPNDCPSASKATLMNMDKYFMWIHYERLHNHNKAKHNKTVCIFLGIYCKLLTKRDVRPLVKNTCRFDVQCIEMIYNANEYSYICQIIQLGNA